MNKMKQITKFLIAAVFAFSVFNFSACDDVEEVELSSGLQQITVTKEPDKLKYNKNDTELDTTGIIVTATYRSGSTKIIPVEELVFSGFKATAGQTNGSEVITVSYTDKSGTFRQTKFQISYTDLSNITITKEPSKLKYCKSDASLDPAGIEVTATNVSGGTEVIPVEKLTFSGFRSEEGVLKGSDVITVSYEDECGTVRQAKYQITYTELAGISIVQSPVTSYKLNAESVEGMIGGIGQKGVNRKGSDQSLSDIADWHFNCEGLKLAVNYVNGDKRFLNFKNGAGSYGTGTSDTKPYVYDNDGNLKYIQRWSEEKDGNNDSYKIRITGFDPIASFKTTENLSGSQIITIAYTEDGKTETTQLQINYDFTAAYKKTETIVKMIEDDIQKILLGDYPQSEKAEGVVINKYKIQNGLFNYQTGSDGNLYVQKVWEKGAKYYRVEPIKWSVVPGYSLTNHYYFQSEKILHNGIPYYSGTSERNSTKQETFQFSVDNVKCAGNVTYTFHISNASFNYSTLRNFLTGESVNGDSTYNGKGFLQTAFSPAVIEGKLKNIPVHEYFDSSVAISGSSGNSSGEASKSYSAQNSGLTYQADYSLKVMIPVDKSVTVESLPKVVERYFFNNGSLEGGSSFASRVDTSDTGNAIKRVWNPAYFNDLSSFDLDYDSSCTTDFTSETLYYWRASDITTCSGINAGRGFLAKDGNITHKGSEGSENQNGIAPIILLEYYE